MITGAHQRAVSLVSKLEPGQWITFPREAMDDIGSMPMLGLMGPNWNPMERVLEGIVGSAWGFSYFEDIRTGNITFTRAKTKPKLRTYVSPDRKHLFNRLPSGHYEAIGDQKPGITQLQA